MTKGFSSRVPAFLLTLFLAVALVSPSFAEVFSLSWGHIADPVGSVYFNSPVTVARDASNNIYVADMSNNRIVKLNSSGTVIATYGSQGSGNGQFNLPFGVA